MFLLKQDIKKPVLIYVLLFTKFFPHASRHASHMRRDLDNESDLALKWLPPKITSFLFVINILKLSFYSTVNLQ